MSEPEVRFAAFRFDAERGLIEGIAVRYGDRASIGPMTEEFRAGAVRADDVILNLQHDRRRPVARSGAGLVLTDGPDALRVSVTLPDTSYAREARELVQARILRGFSVEFRAESDRWEGDHRIVERAHLTGLALVDRPAYPDSVIAERMQSGRPRTRRGPLRFWV